MFYNSNELLDALHCESENNNSSSSVVKRVENKNEEKNFRGTGHPKMVRKKEEDTNSHIYLGIVRRWILQLAYIAVIYLCL